MPITPGGRAGDATPLGKPGGKRRLSDYTREIAHALMRAGHPKEEAIAIARNAEERFAVKSKNPAIRAGALKATAEDKALSHQKRGRTSDHSTPIIGVHDGGRMTSQFGGKKAAPFKKVSAAKMEYAKRAMAKRTAKKTTNLSHAAEVAAQRGLKHKKVS